MSGSDAVYAPDASPFQPGAVSGRPSRPLEAGHPVDIRMPLAGGEPSSSLLSHYLPPILLELKRASASPKRVVLSQWHYQPGVYNAITDVPGVQVGHCTLKRDFPSTVRTGVTAILPHAENLATTALWASGGALNGRGELTGLGPLQGSGVLNSPILLTNTFSVGSVHQGVFQYYEKHYPAQWAGQLPVIGECYDGVFNSIREMQVVQPDHAVEAIEAAQVGPVLQGCVGAGTGMRSFGLHAGIGSASRQVTLGSKTYTLGVLVNSNHSDLNQMNPLVRQALERQLGDLSDWMEIDDSDKVTQPLTASPRQGSIIIVIATDIPMAPHQLQELVSRAGLGVGAMGSSMDTTSGDFVVAFSTANPFSVSNDVEDCVTLQAVHPDRLSPVYRATLEAVTEAQMNALIASH